MGQRLLGDNKSSVSEDTWSFQEVMSISTTAYIYIRQSKALQIWYAQALPLPCLRLIDFVGQGICLSP